MERLQIPLHLSFEVSAEMSQSGLTEHIGALHHDESVIAKLFAKVVKLAAKLWNVETFRTNGGLERIELMD